MPRHETVAVAGVRRPANQPTGTIGRPVGVLTNTFAFRRIPNKTWYHYDKIKKRNTDNVLEELRIPSQNHRIMDHLQTRVAPDVFQTRGVYDGRKNFYHPENIGQDMSWEDVFARVGHTSMRPISVRLTQVTNINFGALAPFLQGTENISPEGQQSIACLNLVLATLPTHRSDVWGDRNIAFPNDQQSRKEIGGGLEVRRGIFQSVRPGTQRLLVHVNTAVGVVHQTGNLLDIAVSYMKSFTNDHRFSVRDLIQLRERERKELARFIKSLRIIPTHRRNYDPQSTTSKPLLISGLVASAAQYRFINEKKGREMTVQQYMQEEYTKRLDFPDLPCVKIGKNALPMELCQVAPGQMLGKNKKLLPQQMRAVLEFSKQRPGERLGMIQRSLGPQGFIGYTSSDYINANGIDIDTSTLMKPARVLPGPQLKYGGDASLNPADGSWNTVKVNLMVPMAVRSWLVVVFVPDSKMQMVGKFLESFRGYSAELGMMLERPIVQLANPSADIFNEMERCCLKCPQPPQICLCITPTNSGPHLKVESKCWGDTQRGVPVQVIVDQKSLDTQGRGVSRQYCHNLALKMNSKLGGVNCALADGVKPFVPPGTLIMGADVSHPAPGSRVPSFCSLVSSVDPPCARYVAQSSPQPPRQETISNLKDMVKVALDYYKQFHTTQIKPPVNSPPKYIIFYRDGVSEGEFASVRQMEVQAIQDALAELRIPPGATKLTFIVVVKKHHFRMFPGREAMEGREKDRSGNCMSGTILDTDVTNPFWNDFYLLSQPGLLGTSRPAHYSVLWDDNNFSPDILQKISYNLCYLHTRSTRAVSIPCVVYWADLVCGRWRYHYRRDGDFNPDDDASSEGGFNLQTWMERWRPLHPNLQRRMYWL